MQLQPKRQPGRVDRKAAAYAAEIVQLRGAGYTFEAIREAIADVGIQLSTSALRREVRRLRVPHQPVPARWSSIAERDRPEASSVSPLQTICPVRGVTTPSPHGLDIAEAFFNAHHSNVLFHSKEIP